MQDVASAQKIFLKTQFQIEGGGLVQGVTKFITTFLAWVRCVQNFMLFC